MNVASTKPLFQQQRGAAPIMARERSTSTSSKIDSEIVAPKSWHQKVTGA